MWGGEFVGEAKVFIRSLISQKRLELAKGIEKMKIKVKLEKPHLFQSPSTSNEFGGYSGASFYCSLCFMGEMDIQDNKLKDGNYACHCSVWTNSCGGKWVKWYDKEKAKELNENYPCEENFRNQAITDIVAYLRKGKLLNLGEKCWRSR